MLQGLAEEKVVYERAKNRTIYLNVAINAIKKLRDEVAAGSRAGTSSSGGPRMPSKNNPRMLSHTAILGGKNAAHCTYTLNRSGGPKKEPENLTGRSHLIAMSICFSIQQLLTIRVL